MRSAVRPERTLRAALAQRGWPVASAPGKVLAYLAVVELCTLSLVALVVTRSGVGLHDLAVGGLLGVLAIVFEEGANRISRLQWRLGPDLKRDMTSVWAVAAAVAISPTVTVVLLVVLCGHLWFRQRRPAGEPLYRNAFTATSIVLAALAAGEAVDNVAAAWSGAPLAVAGALSVLVAIACYTLVNRVLITLALVFSGVRGRPLLGTADDNMTELATLCLGGLVALAALHEPWLCILVVAPMVSLRRGAFVRQLESAATMDAKTGLLNAVAWEHVARRELTRARRDRATVGVLIVDLDHFKAVNDRFGHLAGDSVLRGVGKCIEAAVREYDTVGRFGGEEFVAVLPDISESDAMVVAERIRSRVHELTVAGLVDGVGPGDHPALAVSIGVACTPTDGDELTDLLQSADAALYAAKNAGRNRVRLAHRGTGDARPAFLDA